MSDIFVDIETRSSTDLKNSNVYRYTADPDFKILMMAFAIDDEPVEVETNTYGILQRLEEWIREGHRLIAHNAAFERICFSEHLRRYSTEVNLPGDFYLDPVIFDDSMAVAAENGYPSRLVDLGQWLGGEKKSDAGVHLIRYFCVPRKDGSFNTRADDIDRWESFVAYGVQDVETLRSVWNALPGWPTEGEREIWISDQLINDRGILVDLPLAEAAVAASDENRMVHEIEFSTITGVSNPGSTLQVLEWFKRTGLELPNLQAATVYAALQREDIGDDHRRVLELRKELALVASKKYSAAINRTSADSRLRGSFQFFGAHTGRWAGRGVQLQNLPAATIKPAEGQDPDEAIEIEAIDVTMGLGGEANTLKALVRSMFRGPFTVVDYSAIEARVLAWLAGEDWALEAFRAGRDIYVETAKRMGGLSRKEGKVATLALGYNGGIGALQAMGAQGNDEYLQGLVTQWREANENITAFWADLDSAFWTGGPVGDLIRVVKDGDARTIVLPSGRGITYHSVMRKWETNKWGGRSPRMSFRDPKRGGARVDTYGGRLSENVTQAVARDVLAEGILGLQREGFDVVGHVHDEVLVEGTKSIKDVAEILCSASEKWSAGLPLDAEGYHCKRYRKD